jgi:hypothetical protein
MKQGGFLYTLFVTWRWPLVVVIIFLGTMFMANRIVDKTTKSFAPRISNNTLIQTSVSRLQKEAKLVVLSADVTVEVTHTSSKILFDSIDLGDTVVTLRTRGNRAQYFVPLDQIKESDFHLAQNDRALRVTVPEPRVDESIVEVQTDPDKMEIKTAVGWGRLNKRSGEMARAEAKRSLRHAVVSEAKSPIYVDQARNAAREKVTALLNPLVKQLGVTNVTVEFRR